MKKILSIILSLAFFACALCACTQNERDKLVSNSDGTYTDSETGVTYKPLPSCYEPSNIGAEYKAITVGSMDIMLYGVKGVSTDKLLATEDGDLFASTEYRVTDIGASDVTQIGIYRGDSQSSYINIDDTVDIAVLMNAYLDGERVDYSQMMKTPSLTRTLKLVTREDPNIRYVISYIEYDTDFMYYEVKNTMTVHADSKEELDAEKKIDEDLAKRLSDGEFDNGTAAELGIEKYTYAADDKYVKDDDGMYYYNSNKREFIHANDISEIPANTQRYTLAEYNVEWSVRYNFGKYFLYNKYTNVCTPAGELIHSFVD